MRGVAGEDWAALEPLADANLIHAQFHAAGGDLETGVPRGLGVEVGARAAELVRARAIEPEEMFLDEPHDRAADHGLDAGELQLGQDAGDGGRGAVMDVDGEGHYSLATV